MNMLQKMISSTSTTITSSGEKICPLCQKKFMPKGRQKYCDGPHYKPCPVCGKPVLAPYPSDPPKCCSSECRSKMRSKSDSASITSTEPKLSEPKLAETIIVEPQVEEVISAEPEYPIDSDLELNVEPLQILTKGDKVFLRKQCKVNSMINGLVIGHIYDISVTKDAHVYEVTLSYDHNCRKDLDIVFNVGSAISFNNYFA